MTTFARPQTRALVVAALVTASLSFAACDLVGTRGEGAVTSETRQTETFSRIESGGGIHLSVGIGPASTLQVQAQSNILPLIVTEVVDGTLRIRSSKGFTTSERVDVTLSTPALERIVLSGGSRGDLDGLVSDAFDVQLSGGSVLTATGTANTMTLGVSGGSVGQLDGLTATTISVDLSGGSRVEVRATGLVNGSATGGSRVSVAGGADASVSTTGGSQVEQH
jgi:hypothetical protein